MRIQDQSIKLLDLLSEDGVLVGGKVSYTKQSSKQEFWKHVAMQLNAVPDGVHKTPRRWCKTWADWKTKTLKKANIIFKRRRYNDGNHTAPLTDLEIRLLKLVKYPLPDMADLDKLNMVTIKPDMDGIEPEDFHMEFLTEDSNEQDQDRWSEADVKPFDIQEKEFVSASGDVLQDSEDKTIHEESSLDSESNKGEVEKPWKTNSQNLVEYKIKTTIQLEKEKIQQRSEELRLKALELKLKEDELRLKEIEMNKINHLTNIEEEKLKCFRDIASSLKEFLERPRNGN